MTYVLDLLASSPLLLLFAVIGLGYLAGSVRLFGFSLGPSAVLFTGLFFGALDSRLRIPDMIYVLGLILFVYTIGLQSGPTFFSSFGRRSFRANVTVFGLIVTAAAVSYAGWLIFGLNGASVAGVFCGALTNTPALAAGIEAIKQHIGANPSLAIDPNAPVIGYSVSYPFGVIGMLIGFFFFSKIVRSSPSSVAADIAGDGAPPAGPIKARTFRVANPGVAGKTVAGIFTIDENRGFVLSRLRRGAETSLVYGDTVLASGDLVVAVGDEKALERAFELFGEISTTEVQSENQDFDFRRIEVSDKRVIGKTIGELKLQRLLDVTITRIRRGDVDFVPGGDTVLERGDRVRAITWAGNIERVAKFFGDSVKLSSETDFLSLSLGVVAGVLLGMLPLPLPGGATFTLGFAGGPLIAGLFLGRAQRSGSITWAMPFSVNVTLRQVGLVLFLAGIGTKAGDGFLNTVMQGGWKLMALGAAVTTISTVSGLILARRLLKLSGPAAMGLLSGMQTQPACLAYANELGSTDAPNVWYASVYPVSMIAKIILVQMLVSRIL